MPVLQVPQPGIDVAALEQFGVAPDVVNRAAFEHEDLVRRHQRGQAVRDDDQGAVPGDAQQIGVDDRLAVGIERAGRLVEDQNARIADQRARDRQPLALAARQVGRPLLDEGLVTARQLSMNSSAPASRAAVTISSKLASGLAAAIVSRIEPRNKKFSCSTTPRLERR